MGLIISYNNVIYHQMSHHRHLSLVAKCTLIVNWNLD